MNAMWIDDACCLCLTVVRGFRNRAWCAALLMMGALACGTEPVVDEPALNASSQAVPRLQALDFENGLSANGLSANGLSANGLSANGLSANGLSTNGLSHASFAAWFAQARSHADRVMRYVVRCAVPAGQSRTYTDPLTQHTFTWPGGLGLTPDWASGQPASEAEQQLITACLAAHVNKYGLSVPISILGRDAHGKAIPSTEAELLEYSHPEGCFFGNLFTDEGIFVGADGPLLQGHESSSRACALSSSNPMEPSACSPLTPVGPCAERCQREGTSPFYLTCTWNGVTYRALTTRIRQSERYVCGDGVCQFTESCGPGALPTSCEQDCGHCSLPKSPTGP